MTDMQPPQGEYPHHWWLVVISKFVMEFGFLVVALRAGH